jgi:hypothetical protein
LEYLHERIGYPECLYRKLTPNERDYIPENGTAPHS